MKEIPASRHRRNSPSRVIFVRHLGVPRRFKWSAPFTVAVYRQQPLELAVRR